ncbi:hypothetical protein KLP40_10735 [Hymenobacter sp. NST-14]|uniref:hypothetical protein n=1 Tax=Hymenobacter piscis TaxID=2839984 RepID=UPI001C00E6A5|nr:hypothetical protein [Hymenobacter piscis]MBT9393638.1 hypothetical protein [Hymenobacter piscis]
MQDEINELRRVMQQQGFHAALQYLNHRTPHRYTGVFRFDGELLRNEALFDRLQPAVQQGADVPMAVTYCSLVGRQQAPLEITDATTDARVRGLIDTPVVSYCGVLVRDAQGQPFGTLCHYDLQRCQERTTDQPLLEAAASLFYEYLQAGSRPPAASAAR